MNNQISEINNSAPNHSNYNHIQPSNFDLAKQIQLQLYYKFYEFVFSRGFSKEQACEELGSTIGKIDSIRGQNH
jgi:hypothetical protein